MHVREFKTGIDTEFHAVDSRFQSLSVECGFWIPIINGIPDSLSCIPDSKAQDSWFFCQWNLDLWFQSLVEFRILWAVIRIPKPRNPGSTSENFPDSGIQNPSQKAKHFFFFNECRPWQADWIAPEYTVILGPKIRCLHQVLRPTECWVPKWFFLGQIPTWEAGKLWLGQSSLSFPLLQVYSVRAQPRPCPANSCRQLKW